MVDIAASLLALAVLWRSHRARAETLREIGFRSDNLGRSAWLVGRFVVPLVLAMAALGMALELQRQWPVEGLGERVVSMLAFGILQQYLLIGFYLRRFEEILARKTSATVAASSVFALLHAPAPWLIVVTFLAGLGASWLSRRAANLWVLGIAHGLLSVTLSMFLAGLLPAGLKVGLRALG